MAKTKVIIEESQVPAGWVRISELAKSNTDQKRLSDAHAAGALPAVKLMRSIDDRTGPVWVCPAEAAKILERPKRVSVSDDSDSIARLVVAAERSATALEIIATNPTKQGDTECP